MQSMNWLTIFPSNTKGYNPEQTKNSKGLRTKRTKHEENKQPNARKMIQGLRSLLPLPENPGLSLKTHMVSNEHR